MNDQIKFITADRFGSCGSAYDLYIENTTGKPKHVYRVFREDGSNYLLDEKLNRVAGHRAEYLNNLIDTRNGAK